METKNENKGTKSFGKTAGSLSYGQAVQSTVFNDGTLTKEDIKKGLERDLKGLWVFVGEILNTPLTLDTLVDAYYARYEKLQAAKAVAPELDLKKQQNEFHKQ